MKYSSGNILFHNSQEGGKDRNKRMRRLVCAYGDRSSIIEPMVKEQIQRERERERERGTGRKRDVESD